MRNLLLVLLSLVVANSAGAENISPEQEENYLQQLAQALKPAVYELQRPIYTWNWFNAQNRKPVWQTAISATDPVGYYHMVNSSKNFYQAYCSENESKNPPDCESVKTTPLFGQWGWLGPGLYLAVDPVATESYGGLGENWVLMQVRLPKGLRILQREKLGTVMLQNFLKQHGCRVPSFEWASQGRSYVNTRGNDSACAPLLRRVFKEILKIEAFAFRYDGTTFDACQDIDDSGKLTKRTERDMAVVLANSARLTPDDVRIFNSKSFDGDEDRSRILALFFEKYSVNSQVVENINIDWTAVQEVSSTALPHLKLDIGKSKDNPKPILLRKINGRAEEMVEFWYQSKDSNAAFKEVLPLKLVVHKDWDPREYRQYKTWQKSYRNWLTKYVQRWPDMEGKPVFPNVKSWLQENLLGCQDPMAWQPAVF